MMGFYTESLPGLQKTELKCKHANFEARARAEKNIKKQHKYGIYQLSSLSQKERQNKKANSLYNHNSICQTPMKNFHLIMYI